MKKAIYRLTIILLIGILLVSSYFVLRDYKEDKEQNQIFKELQNIVEESIEITEKKEENMDLQRLYELNSDFVGWLKIEDSNINYPIMQSKDRPNYYLNRNFYKKYSSNGTPYIAENCDLKKSNNLIIYGHHINGKRVFGELENYKREDYYKKHKVIKFYTLEEQAEYEIISVFTTIAYSEKGFDYYNYYNLKDKKEFDIFINKCNELCLYNTNQEVKYGDKFITLSTCEYSHKDRTISDSGKEDDVGGGGIVKYKNKDKKRKQKSNKKTR